MRKLRLILVVCGCVLLVGCASNKEIAELNIKDRYAKKYNCTPKDVVVDFLHYPEIINEPDAQAIVKVKTHKFYITFSSVNLSDFKENTAK